MASYVCDLADRDRDGLTRQFLSARGDACARFACFELEGTDPFANIARQVEREVFQQSFGNDPAMLTEEYAPYEESSLFFLAVDTEAQTPAGVLRMIRNSPAGLKTLVDLEDSAKTPTTVRVEDVRRFHGIEDLSRCWDGATATVPRRYRRSLATIHLHSLRAWYRAARRENIEHLFSILDATVYKAVRAIYRLPIVPLADIAPFTYMGGTNHQPVYAHLPTTLHAAAIRNRKLAQKVSICVSEGSRGGMDYLAHR